MPMAQSGPFSVWMPGQLTSEQAVQSILDNRLRQRTMGLQEQEAAGLAKFRDAQILTEKIKQVGNVVLVDPEAAKRMVETDPILSARIGSITVQRSAAGTEVTTASGLKLFHDGKSWKQAKTEVPLEERRANLRADTARQLAAAEKARRGPETDPLRDRDVVNIRNTIQDNARAQAVAETRQQFPTANILMMPLGDVEIKDNPEAYKFFRRRTAELERRQLGGISAPMQERVRQGLSLTSLPQDQYDQLLAEGWTAEEIAAQGYGPPEE